MAKTNHSHHYQVGRTLYPHPQKHLHFGSSFPAGQTGDPGTHLLQSAQKEGTNCKVSMMCQLGTEKHVSEEKANDVAFFVNVNKYHENHNVPVCLPLHSVFSACLSSSGV